MVSFKKFLAETPVHLGAIDANEKNFVMSYMSTSAVARDYDKIGEFANANDVYQIFQLQSDKKFVFAGKVTKKPGRNEDVFSMDFLLEFKTEPTIVHYPSNLDRSKVLQVNWVQTNPHLKNRGLATYVYMLLASNGFVVVSDIAQFDGGQHLWKRLAKETDFNKCVVRIIDDEYGYMKDDAGKIVEYDGANVPDNKIWTYGADMTGEHILLMLKSEK